MEQFWPAFLSGVAAMMVAGVLGWLWIRVQRQMQSRPDFRVRKHPSGVWQLVSVRRKPVYDLTVHLSQDGRRVSPEGGEYVEIGGLRNGSDLPAQYAWDSITVTWLESPRRVAHGWRRDGVDTVDLERPAHQPPSLAERVRKLFD